MMASETDWRKCLSFATRLEYIQAIQRGLENTKKATPANSPSVAYAIETDIFKKSSSRELHKLTSKNEYDLECSAYDEAEIEGEVEVLPLEENRTSVLSIGDYTNCHHIASGMVSEVYRSAGLAIKVITETRDVEPHNPAREIKILQQISHESIIKLIENKRDSDKRLLLIFPYMSHTLSDVISSTVKIPRNTIFTVFHALFSALSYLHSQGIIHRDIKPSNILLSTRHPQTYSSVKLADFGTAWHPTLSISDEPANHKVLEVGTTSYRAPEALFGNRSYTTSLDMWASGCVLAECLTVAHKQLFESRSTEEDGNQLGLILSIFKTLGTPTKESWPEAVDFSTPPFEWYQEFPGKSWEDLLPGVDQKMVKLVMELVKYESRHRMTAVEALAYLDTTAEETN